MFIISSQPNYATAFYYLTLTKVISMNLVQVTYIRYFEAFLEYHSLKIALFYHDFERIKYHFTWQNSTKIPEIRSSLHYKST